MSCDSPLKMEPTENVPLPFEILFALHIRMVQNSLGNCKYLIINVIISQNFLFIYLLYIYLNYEWYYIIEFFVYFFFINIF